MLHLQNLKGFCPAIHAWLCRIVAAVCDSLWTPFDDDELIRLKALMVHSSSHLILGFNLKHDYHLFGRRSANRVATTIQWTRRSGRVPPGPAMDCRCAACLYWVPSKSAL
jgi:hypothetical protein